MIDDIITKILFTHDNYFADYTGNRDSKIDYMEHRLQVIAPQKPQNRGPSTAAATSARRVNAGKIITRSMLLEQVWDFHFDPKTTVVETHISRLRNKVDKSFPSELIVTIRGVGYCLSAPA